jgi:hypothetical protein
MSIEADPVRMCGHSGTQDAEGQDITGGGRPIAELWHTLWQQQEGEFLNRLRPYGHHVPKYSREVLCQEHLKSRRQRTVRHSSI